jgi:hypothetical protein
LVFKYACGSTTGAGAIIGEAIGAETEVPPQLLHPLLHPPDGADAHESQEIAESHELLFL